MPYYQEWFVNDFLSDGKFGSDTQPVIADQTLVTGFRSRGPHAYCVSSREVLDIQVDPYAYFLTSIDQKRYFDALKDRGISARFPPDRGHPFELVRHRVDAVPRNVKYFNQTWTNAIVGYAGSELNDVHDGNHTKIPTWSSSGLDTFARQAYSRVAPSSVVFDAANFLGELHERLPSFSINTLKSATRSFRGLGSDYLNVAFGWKPFVDDIIRAGLALAKATEELSSDGHSTYRRYSVPPTSVNRSITSMSSLAADMRAGLGQPSGFIPSGFPIPSKVNGYSTPLGATVSGASEYQTRWASKSFEQIRWFEGLFTSFYPLGFDPSNYLEKLNILVNTKVTPEVLWNLTPWTWLVDWTLRVGDSIRANQLRANDLLIMHYGYAMETSIYLTESSFSNPTNSGITNFPSTMGMRVTTTRKRRIRANPYGFGIGGAGALSASQLAILGALGLTKFG